MLQQRIITALVLLAILLPALFYPSPEPFMLVALVLICLAAWEWGQLNGYSGLAFAMAVQGHACAVAHFGRCLGAAGGVDA
jgi:CDP-diglyceride synthetase